VLGGGESVGSGWGGEVVVDEASGCTVLRIWSSFATISHIPGQCNDVLCFGVLLTCTYLSWMCTAPVRCSYSPTASMKSPALGWRCHNGMCGERVSISTNINIIYASTCNIRPPLSLKSSSSHPLRLVLVRLRTSLAETSRCVPLFVFSIVTGIAPVPARR
jgi:hypothetical protein